MRQCKKAITQGDLTEEECLLRLRRWLVAGLQDEDWPQNKRDYHIAMGGMQLAQFAEGMSLEDLNDTVGHRSG